MSRANKNIRDIVSDSRASDRAKSTTNLDQAMTAGKITSLNASASMSKGTYHSNADSGIKAPSNFPQRGAASQGLGRTGRAIVENQSLVLAAKPPLTGAASMAPATDSAEQQTKENQVVLEPGVLDNLSLADLKRSYITLGREFKQKANTVLALQRNFQVVSKLCQAEQDEKEKVLAQT